MSFIPKLVAFLSQTIIHKTQETVLEAISANYNLLPNSSLGICFNKLFTNLGLPTLINCDYKTARGTPKNTLLYTKLENLTLSTRHLSLELSTNVTNQTERNLKRLGE
jgi:hypothetical protein